MLGALAIALVAVVPYMGTTGNGFVVDDVPIVAKNRRLRGDDALTLVLTTDWWGGQARKSLLYRPLTMASFALDHRRVEAPEGIARLPDAAARPFHRTNVVLHALASVALFVALLVAIADFSVALPASLLFAAHPVHAEAVAAVVGRAELLAATFGLLALAAAVRVLRGAGRPALGAAVSGALLLAALLSKESAVAIPAVVAAWAFCFPARGGGAQDRRRALSRVLAAQGVAVAVYVGVRVAVLGTLLGIATPTGSVDVDNPLVGAPVGARILTAASIQRHVLRLLVWPRTMAADYGYDQLPVASRPDAASLLGLAAAAGLIAAALWLRPRLPAASFGLLVVPATFALTSNVPFPIGTIFAERLLFLPSAGIGLAAAALLSWRLPRAAVAGLVALAVLAGGSRAARRCRDFADNATLAAASAAASPRSATARSAHAEALVSSGLADEAVAEAEAAVAIHPGLRDAHATLGTAYRMLASQAEDHGRRMELLARARRHVQEQVRLAQGVADDGLAAAGASIALGGLLVDEGRSVDALDLLRQAASARPDLVAGHVGVGVAYLARSELTEPPRRVELLREALASLGRALALEPESLEAHQALGAAHWRLARGGEPGAARTQHLVLAERHEREALRLKLGAGAPAPARAEGHTRLGDVLAARGALDLALGAFREASSLTPDAARPRVGAGVVLGMQAERATDEGAKTALVGDAIAAFEEALRLEPANADAHLNIGIALLRERRDPEAAEAHLRTYLKLAPPGAPQEALVRAALAGLERTDR